MQPYSQCQSRVARIALWIEGLLFGAGVLYWLFVDPSHLLGSGFVWGLAGLACLIVASAMALYFYTRVEPDPLSQLDRRNDIDKGIRANQK